MAWLPKLAQAYSKHKGFIQLVVAEVEDENIIIPVALWESEEDSLAALPDFAALRDTFDFSIQDGPTRAGRAAIKGGSIFTALKVRPVTPPTK
ncbi:MAG TPA: hypothetical protein VEJ19_08980 [Nitrososphaerales archaeon]|nr:hypothetical protein [Nitrososphaerales archaeon]